MTSPKARTSQRGRPGVRHLHNPATTKTVVVPRTWFLPHPPARDQVRDVKGGQVKPKPDHSGVKAMLSTTEEPAELLKVRASCPDHKATTGGVPCTFRGNRHQLSDTDLQGTKRPRLPHGRRQGGHARDELSVTALARRLDRRDQRRARAQWREDAARTGLAHARNDRPQPPLEAPLTRTRPRCGDLQSRSSSVVAET
jgi:hypothetical protein